MRKKRGELHHVELWVPDFKRAEREWGWLLSELGYQLQSGWEGGKAYELGPMYLVIEESTALSAAKHDRLRPGLNHLAFHAGDAAQVDALMEKAPHHGWAPLFVDSYPHASGPQTYAGYLTNSDGFEVELVGSTWRSE